MKKSMVGLRQAVAHCLGGLSIRMGAALLALGLTGAASAATYTWTGGGTPTDGAYAWNDAANWGGGGYPASGDTAELSTAGATIAIPSGGATCYRIYATAGNWRMTGSGTLTITDAAPFSSGTTTYDKRVGVITFDCPVNFSATGDKTILNGNIFNNTVALGTTGRAFFMKGDATGTSPLVVFSGNRTYDYSGNNNVCCGKNDSNVAHGGEMYVQDGATLKAKLFYDFAGSTTTITNGTLITTTSGTSVSLDLVLGAVLNVMAGGTLDCKGKMRIGQSSEGGAPKLNVLGGTVTIANVAFGGGGSAVPTITVDDGGSVTVTSDLAANTGTTGSGLYIGKGSLTVGGTLTHGSVQKTYFTVPADQQLGSVTAGTIKPNTAGNKVPIVIMDDTLANGTVYTLMTDQSKTMTLDGYDVTYNGMPADQKGTLALNDGVLTFQPTANAVVWTGAGDGVTFNDAANWNGGVKPFNGCSLYFTTTADGNLQNDMDGLVLSQLQFSSGCGTFNISGNAITMDGTIINRSANPQTLSCAIAAPTGSNLYTDFTSAPVVFAGGATGLDLVGPDDFSRTIHGTMTFTKTQPEDDTENDLWSSVTYTVATGSTLNIPGELFVRNGYGDPRFVIEQGATMNVGTYKCRAAFPTFDVKGTLNAGLLWGVGFTPVFTTATSTGTVNAGGIRISANGAHELRTARVNVGADGIKSIYGGVTAASGVNVVNLAEGTTLGATADWSLAMLDTTPIFALVVNGNSTLDSDGHVVTINAPLTGTGTLALTDDTILDITAVASTVQLAPAAGAVIRTTPALTKSVPLVPPASGQVGIALITTDGVPRGTVFTLFENTGLTAADAAKFAVTVPGQDDVQGTLAISEGQVIFTVTESNTEPGTLVWRPIEEAETVWDASVISWIDQTTGASSPWRGFSNVLFDGQESFTGGAVNVPADVNVGNITFDSDTDYTLTGTGRLVGQGAFLKDGTGTLTLDGPALTEQPAIMVSEGVLKLGTNLAAKALGTLGTNSTLSIAKGAQLDLNYTLTSSNDATRNSLTGDKLVTVAGDGPDGTGAIVNNGGSTTWFSALTQVKLLDDTSFGGISRIDFRKGSAGQTYTNRPYIAGAGYTFTSKVVPSGGRYGVHLNNTDVDVDQLVIAPGASVGMEGTVNLTAPNGLVIDEGGHLDLYGNPLDDPNNAGTVIKAAEGVAAEIYNGAGTANVNLPVEVPEGSTLGVSTSTINFNKTIVNSGTFHAHGGTQNFYGPMTGGGAWTSTGGTVYFRTSSVPAAFDWTVSGSTTFYAYHAAQMTGSDLSLTGAGSFVWGNYEAEGNPAAKSVTLSDNMNLAVCAAVSQTLPPMDVANTNQGCRIYADNLTTKTKFVEGDWLAKFFHVGGTSRGGHFSFHTGTSISVDQFHIGNEAYAAPRALCWMEGGTLEIGSIGMLSAYAPLGTFAIFESGTIRAKTDSLAKWGFPGIFGNESDSAPLVFDVGEHDFYYRSGLGGKSNVRVTGTGGFFTTQPYEDSDLFQDYAEGRWSAEAATNDLSGASAIAGGLDVAAGSFARVCIRNDELCEFARFGTTDWEAIATNGCQAVWQIANNMNHLHLKLTTSTKVYNNHTFVYRGQFLVEEAGTWTFAGTYDDRIAFIVDGARVFATTGSSSVSCGSVELAEGWHDYLIVIYDGSGTQGPTAWNGVGLGWTNVATTSTAQADYRKFALGDPSCGLKFRLANSMQWERKTMARLETFETINTEGDFETLTVTNSLRAIGLTDWNQGNMALNRFRGSFYVSAELAGSWRFFCSYDDFCSIKIDGVDSGSIGRESSKNSTAAYELAEGWHSFEIRTYDRGGGWGPWVADNADYAVGVTITPAATGVALARQAFDERNFRFVRVQKPARAGLDGVVDVAEGGVLENGAGEDAWCPVWGTLAGAGELRGNFRLKGATWRLTGDARNVKGVQFAANSKSRGPDTATLAELGAIDVQFSAQPTRPKYEVGPALGLTAEAAAALPVTAAYEGQGTRPCSFTAKIENDRLMLVNANPGGVVLLIR